LNQAKSAGTEQATALVVEAEPPLDNLIKSGRRSQGSVRILIGDGADAKAVLGGRHKRDKEHWLAPGMEIPVSVDPANPEAFEIRWEEIPSMAERTAAGDPALVDPVGTRRKLSQALIEATSAVPISALPSDLAAAVSKAQAGSADPIHPLDEQLSEAEGRAAPAGRQSAVVVIATQMVKLATDGGPDDASSHTYETREGKHDAVLSVYLPKQQPYAVYVEKLKHPRRSGFAGFGGIPATVSLSDPNDIDLDWKSAKAEGEARVNRRLEDANEQMRRAMSGQPVSGQAEELEQAWSKATEDAIKRGPPPGLAPSGGAPQINPQMRQMMIQNAKVALANCPPQMREMMIQQYRMAGIEIDDKGNVVE
jgi:hypothetical protein